MGEVLAAGLETFFTVTVFADTVFFAGAVFCETAFASLLFLAAFVVVFGAACLRGAFEGVFFTATCRTDFALVASFEGFAAPLDGLETDFEGFAAGVEGFVAAFRCLVEVACAGCLVAPLRAVEDLTVAFSFAEDIEEGPFDWDLETAAAFADRVDLGAILGDDAEARGECLDGISLKARVF